MDDDDNQALMRFRRDYQQEFCRRMPDPPLLFVTQKNDFFLKSALRLYRPQMNNDNESDSETKDKVSFEEQVKIVRKDDEHVLHFNPPLQAENVPPESPEYYSTNPIPLRFGLLLGELKYRSKFKASYNVQSTNYLDDGGEYFPKEDLQETEFALKTSFECGVFRVAPVPLYNSSSDEIDPPATTYPVKKKAHVTNGAFTARVPLKDAFREYMDFHNAQSIGPGKERDVSPLYATGADLRSSTTVDG